MTNDRFESLEGKRFVLVGGTGAIGSALATRLAARGASLVLLARSENRLGDKTCPAGAESVCLDATKPDQVDAAFEHISSGGDVHGVAHLVGSILLRPAHLTSSEDWHRTLMTNLYSAFYTLRAAIKVITRAGGSIAFVSSAAGSVGLPNHEAISAAKAGLEGLVRSSAASYAASGIRVNAVSPGLVKTPLSEQLLSNPAAERNSTSMHPLKRLGEPEDVARVLEFLLDPANSWLTGQIIGVDGGLSSLRTRTAA